MFQLDLAVFLKQLFTFLIDISLFNYPMSHLDMTDDAEHFVSECTFNICKILMITVSVVRCFHLSVYFILFGADATVMSVVLI